MNNNKIVSLYVILGGTKENMRFRADKVLDLTRELSNPSILIAGLPNEVEFMSDYYSKRSRHQYHIRSNSWDTLTNLTLDIFPFIAELQSLLALKGIDECATEIIAPTGNSHGERLMKAFRLVIRENEDLFLECPLSEDEDGKYEILPSLFYAFGKPGIYFSSWIDKLFREKN